MPFILPLRDSQMQSKRLSAVAGPCQIPLTQGEFAVVDPEDFERISAMKWHAVRANKKCYAKRDRTYMHHEIMGFPEKGFVIDHINGNGLDNRKSNLRFATFSQNASNSVSNRRYRCVFSAPRNTFVVRIAHDSQQHYGGVFKNISQAACAANALLSKLHGPHARLNDVGAANDA